MMKRSLILLGILFLTGGALADVADGPWVITTDYSVFGGIEALDDSAPWTPSGQLSVIPSDAVARWHEGLIYVVGRGGGQPDPDLRPGRRLESGAGVLRR